MKSMQINEALILYVGYELSMYPILDKTAIYDVEILRKCDEILISLNAIKPNWEAHTLLEACANARIKIQQKYPMLDTKSLDALQWVYSYGWK